MKVNKNIIILASGPPKNNRTRHLEIFNGEPLINLVVEKCRIHNTKLYVVIDKENTKLIDHVCDMQGIQILLPKDKKMYSTFEAALHPTGDCIMVAGDLISLKDGDVKKFVDSEYQCAIMKYKIPWGADIACGENLIRRGDIGDSINKIAEKYKSQYLSEKNVNNAKKYFKLFFPNKSLNENMGNHLWTWMDYAFYNEIMANPSCDAIGEKGTIFFEHQIYLDND